ncbi:mRNA-decapping enzyme 1A isoform X1 [Varanus komodoensis]|uniref:5'-(N(7)-methylguanosine 5'-triphospho)-[mRNA] hydrolase n=2 Tax=Varanus komodoensis TaxID=61221 RepID=A0A8D2KYL4_VARKO|nr:mRNA-decapping enzyme 1A isoform X1 [Varanus komodoensis]
MESLSKVGQEMSLAALKQHDPYITSIADVTGQVALYRFNPKANEWEKTDVEGTLFVYKRSASPYYGFTIVNRLNMHNLVEPVNKDLEFQLHEPFLLYRNANLSIYSIWFYDKNDCQRIAKLMAKVVQEETQRSQLQDRRSISKINGCTDILEMLSKAKVEYERVRKNQKSDLICGTPQTANPTKTENAETSEHGSSVLQMQDHPCQSIPKHLTVEELFGTSVPKEHTTVPYSSPETTEKIDIACREHSLLLPFSLEQSTVIHQSLGKLDTPNLRSNSGTLLPQDCVPPLLIASPLVSQPEQNKVSNYTVPLSPVLNSALATEAPCVQMLQSLNTNNNIKQVMHQTAKQVTPLVNQPSTDMNHGPQTITPGQNQFLTSLAAANTGDASNTPLPNMDLFQKLRLTPQHDQMQQPLSKTPVAPNSTPSISQLATPDCFKESHIKQPTVTGKMIPPVQVTQQSKELETFPNSKALPKVASPQFATATTTMTPSVLLSPSVFQQSAMKSSEMENKVGSSSPLTLGAVEVQTLPPTVLSRSQLQETLIHLIKNDAKFLNTLHEVYVQVLTKNTDSIKL